MLKIENVSRTFNPGTVNEKKAIDHLFLSVEDHDFITILGSNGAGKSTLFQLIAGSEIPDEGRIVLDDKDITFEKDYRRAKYIGRLFQDPLKGTAPHMTIEENLALAYLRASSHTIGFSHVSRKEKEMFQDALKELNMGLEDRMKTPVGTLSGGQRQALTLLMATICPPKILLLDEHTAALDPASAEKILALTKKIVSEHQMICLMITHNLEQALKLGNRTVIMHDGKVVSDLKEERKDMSVKDLMDRFRLDLDDDRILLEA